MAGAIDIDASPLFWKIVFSEHSNSNYKKLELEDFVLTLTSIVAGEQICLTVSTETPDRRLIERIYIRIHANLSKDILFRTSPSGDLRRNEMFTMEKLSVVVDVARRGGLWRF